MLGYQQDDGDQHIILIEYVDVITAQCAIKKLNGTGMFNHIPNCCILKVENAPIYHLQVFVPEETVDDERAQSSTKWTGKNLH
jgi:hypothetical protein